MRALLNPLKDDFSEYLAVRIAHPLEGGDHLLVVDAVIIDCLHELLV